MRPWVQSHTQGHPIMAIRLFHKVYPWAPRYGRSAVSQGIGKRIVRTESVFKPVKSKVRQIVQQAAKYTACSSIGLFCCHLQLYRLELSISSSHVPSFTPVPDKVFPTSSMTLNASLASTIFWINKHKSLPQNLHYFPHISPIMLAKSCERLTIKSGRATSDIFSIHNHALFFIFYNSPLLLLPHKSHLLHPDLTSLDKAVYSLCFYRLPPPSDIALFCTPGAYSKETSIQVHNESGTVHFQLTLHHKILFLYRKVYLNPIG